MNVAKKCFEYFLTILVKFGFAKSKTEDAVTPNISITLKTSYTGYKVMDIYCFRKWFTDTSTISELFVDDFVEKTCFILEDTVRHDAPGPHAIPEGRYEITLYDSPRFKMKVPLLNRVPGRDYIEIHPGNTPEDTIGCLLPGLERGKNIVGRSREAFNILFPIIDKALNTKQVFITIKNSGNGVL